MRRILEICVDSPDGIAAAAAGGADRLELCAALALGGLTPSPGLIAAAKAAGRPVMAMIRPRAGNFVWSGAEVAVMEADIAAVRAAGLAGVVIGASRPDGRLDAEVLGRLVAAARGMDVTLHRAFDLAPDRDKALDLAAALGIARVLTSGGTPQVDEEEVARLARRGAGRVVVMPGSGVTPQVVVRLAARMGAVEVHASASAPATPDPLADRFGYATPRATSLDAVRALRRALDLAP